MRNVRGGGHPGQACVPPYHRAFPAFHRNDRQLALVGDPMFSIDHSSQLAASHSIDIRYLPSADHGTIAVVERGTFYPFAAERIGPIQNDEFHTCLATSLHG